MTKVYEPKFKDKLILGLDQLRLKLFKKEWTPACEDYEFCCIVCGRIHHNITFFDSSMNPSITKLKGEKTAKELYTLDFCSIECANKYSKQAEIELFNFAKLNDDLEHGSWKNRWTDYYNWRNHEH